LGASYREATRLLILIVARQAKGGGLKGTVVTIDAIACNGIIAKAVRDAGADYLLALKANQPTLRREIEDLFVQAPAAIIDRTDTETDKGQSRIEQRTVTLAREVDWLNGNRRFPGELRLPDVAAIIKVESKAELKDRCRVETRYYTTSADFTAEAAAQAVRDHWGIENQFRWVLDAVFGEDQSRLQKGHGAKNMAVVRHFAINHVRIDSDPAEQKRSGLRRKTNTPPEIYQYQAPQKMRRMGPSISTRRPPN